MSGLRILFSMLPMGLICLIGVVSYSHADGPPSSGLVPGEVFRLESRVPGHVDSLWSHFKNQSATADLNVVAVQGTWGHQRFEADIVEMTLHDAMSACERGDINLLPFERVLPDGAELADYIWNGLQPCAVGHSVWADLIVFDETRYIDQPTPALLKDFFNIDAFPGKRAIPKSPRTLAEWILLTQEVPRAEVYDALAAKEAWSRIEEALVVLEPGIIWVDSDAEALARMDSGEATFALVSSKNLVQRIAHNKKIERNHDHYGVIWNEAVAHMSFLTLPKRERYPGATGQIVSADNLLRFLRYVSEPQRNLELSTAIGYAPVNRDQTVMIDVDYREALPIDAQVSSLFWGNDKWWRENGGELRAKLKEFTNRKLSTL